MVRSLKKPEIRFFAGFADMKTVGTLPHGVTRATFGVAFARRAGPGRPQTRYNPGGDVPGPFAPRDGDAAARFPDASITWKSAKSRREPAKHPVSNPGNRH